MNSFLGPRFSLKKQWIVARCVFALAVTVGLALASFAGQAEKKFPDPVPRKDAILKLFADEFIAITPGKGKFPTSFIRGSDKGPSNEAPVAKVTMGHDFAMAKYEVTQELYQVIMGNNPAKWKGPRNSVEMVHFEESQQFCDKATKELRQRRLLGENEKIRLPTEAEWEYCCRAGTTTLYSFGDDVSQLTHYGWYAVNAPGNDPPVGSKKGNPWDLHEMHGYVAEWCLDTWHPNYEGAPSDGSARIDAKVKHRVIRGGSYGDKAELLRSAARVAAAEDTRNDRLGLRCVKAR